MGRRVAALREGARWGAWGLGGAVWKEFTEADDDAYFPWAWLKAPSSLEVGTPSTSQLARTEVMFSP